MRGDREHLQAVQRVKVALVGLVAVVLLMGLASAIMRTVTHEAPVVAVGASKADVVANLVIDNGQVDAGEPLAELGVAPAAGNLQSPGSPAPR